MPLPEIPYDPWFHDKPHPHDSMPIATDDTIDTMPSECQPPGVDEEIEEIPIHEKMYRIATSRHNPFSINSGGSENCHSDLDCNIGGSEQLGKP